MQFPPLEQLICFPKSAVSRSKKDMTPQKTLEGGEWILANRDGAMSAAREPAESAAPHPLADSEQEPRRPGGGPAKDAPCEPVKSATTLPLATASQRLRGRPGRPRTKPCGDNPGDSREPERTQVRVRPARPAARPQDSPSCAPPGPRLVTRQQAAEYLSLSLDMIDRLTQQGELPRVQLLLGNRNVRKVLYDRADLDRLVELSRIV
jgi:excisionase family DNA binding protein